MRRNKKAFICLYWKAFYDGRMVEQRKSKLFFLKDPRWTEARNRVIQETMDVVYKDKL